jgi:hypothetical protein
MFLGATAIGLSLSAAARNYGVAAPSGVPSTPLLAGTYRAVDPSTRHPLHPGNELIVRSAGIGSLRFTLNAIRALDLNTGTISGTIIDKLPSTFAQTAPGGKCRLHFAAARRGVSVQQDVAFGDCGFGYGVLADGLYERIDR